MASIYPRYCSPIRQVTMDVEEYRDGRNSFQCLGTSAGRLSGRSPGNGFGSFPVGMDSGKPAQAPHGGQPAFARQRVDGEFWGGIQCVPVGGIAVPVVTPDRLAHSTTSRRGADPGAGGYVLERPDPALPVDRLGPGVRDYDVGGHPIHSDRADRDRNRCTATEPLHSAATD